jgi:hypothetical protein
VKHWTRSRRFCRPVEDPTGSEIPEHAVSRETYELLPMVLQTRGLGFNTSHNLSADIATVL